MAVHLDETLRFGEQHGRYTGPTVMLRHIDLFDLVIDHHHEPGYCVIDDRDHRVADPLRSSQSERLPSPGSEDVIRNVPQMAVPPSVVPDIRDCLRVIRTRGTKRDGRIAG